MSSLLAKLQILEHNEKTAKRRKVIKEVIVLDLVIQRPTHRAFESLEEDWAIKIARP